MTEIRTGCSGRGVSCRLLLNQRCCEHRASEVMAKDVGYLALLCESEVTEVPEELAGVNPLLGVMMHSCC